MKPAFLDKNYGDSKFIFTSLFPKQWKKKMNNPFKEIKYDFIGW